MSSREICGAANRHVVSKAQDAVRHVADLSRYRFLVVPSFILIFCFNSPPIIIDFFPSFGAFPDPIQCFDAIQYGASGVFTDEECPFLKADFLEACCGTTVPFGTVCPICGPDQVLINP
jgi:hypothetical protein